MGLYMLINESDRKRFRDPQDETIKELFNEALSYDKSLMISEHTYIEKRFLRKPKIIKEFTIFHELFQLNGNPSYEAQELLSASGDKRIVMAYLYGIINGASASQTL